MKLLLDEMLSPAIARVLRERGHDVVAVKERAEWVGMADDDLLAAARREGRAIATKNLRDFAPLHADLVVPGEPGHAGLVFIPTSYRLTKASMGSLAAALERVLAEFPDDDSLADGITWLS